MVLFIFSVYIWFYYFNNIIHYIYIFIIWFILIILLLFCIIGLFLLFMYYVCITSPAGLARTRLTSLTRAGPLPGIWDWDPGRIWDCRLSAYRL